MPVLKNSKHEKLAQGLVAGLSGKDAMLAAGFKCGEQNLDKYKKDPLIAARILELKERAAKEIMIDRQWVLERLVENAQEAKELQEFSASNQALSLIGKELGMFVERTENINVEHTISGELPTAEQWIEEHGAAH
jgi:coenzyme F420-reducing hydrogenase delta subunit